MAPKKVKKPDSRKLNSPWAADTRLKPPFKKGMVLVTTDNATHVKKGTLVVVSRLQHLAGDWFIHFIHNCPICSDNKEKKKKVCGGWYACHFAYPEKSHGNG